MTTLAEALADYGPQAYLLTVAPEGPHTSVVLVTLNGRRCRFTPSKSARRNAGAHPQVSLLWPAREPDGYCVILNGRLSLNGEGEAELEISKSVLHRPGSPQHAGGACTSDCVQLSL